MINQGILSDNKKNVVLWCQHDRQFIAAAVI